MNWDISDYPELFIGIEILSEFRNKMRETFGKMTREQLESPAYLFDHDKRALRFSFNNEWDCFIGNTHGFTHNEDRVYLDAPMPKLLVLISDRMLALKIYQRAGGRLFIDQNSCFYKDEYRQSIILFRLQWPPKYKIDIYDDLMDIRKHFLVNQ